jgi:hypothetical protein
MCWEKVLDLFFTVSFFVIRNVLRGAVYERNNMNQAMDDTMTRRMFYANRYKRIRDYEILMDDMVLVKHLPYITPREYLLIRTTVKEYVDINENAFLVFSSD